MKDYAQSQRLLLLSCSRRKRQDAGLLPAIARYDGPAFRVTRRFLREHPENAPDILILSAEYGLIHASQQVPHYNRQMTGQRSRELSDSVADGLTKRIRAKSYCDFFVYGGRVYLDTLLRRHDMWAEGIGNLSLTSGVPGQKLSELYRWLHIGVPDIPAPRKPKKPTFRLRGRIVRATKEDAVRAARQAFSSGTLEAFKYHWWYIEIDGRRLSPKWIVSRLCGLSVGEFHTDDARRILTNLGLEARCGRSQ